MTFMRAARVDRNQPEVVDEFRRLGFSVLITSQLKNCCDLIVAKRGRSYCVEVKDGKKPPSQRKLSLGEERFKNEWQGEWRLVETLDDVYAINEEIENGN